MTAALAPAVLDVATWQARRQAHEERVDVWLTPYLARRRRGERHPVEDFLFTYYSHRPAQLRRWHPGAGVELRDAEPAEFGRDYRATSAGVTLDTEGVRVRRGESITWIRSLLAATAGRTPHFGCFGMHEWAMVYRQNPEELRHNAWPLRLGPERTAAVVEERGVRCSHFDAYRFFTPSARPLNLLNPTRETQHVNEQPGCLHANMDLYKWAYKLSPLVPSELVADCFELAREIRTLDMRASPYDLAALGHPPVRVETPEGRAEYATAQRGFADRAAALRARLLAALGAHHDHLRVQRERSKQAPHPDLHHHNRRDL
ncbi:3-methyladenine DNA glycosylase [Micromonospora sp. DT4]|uniref:3-methyladenine DNA glycosylase n=1 Tax=Micromonospora sp. DT4 TaxID=3393438 RepID=UPI003CFB2C2E